MLPVSVKTHIGWVAVLSVLVQDIPCLYVWMLCKYFSSETQTPNKNFLDEAAGIFESSKCGGPALPRCSGSSS
jgi:hypothetical protein